MLHTSILQAVIDNNSNTIRNLEAKVKDAHDDCYGVPMRVKLSITSPYRKKIRKLARIQVELKKELLDVITYQNMHDVY